MILEQILKHKPMPSDWEQVKLIYTSPEFQKPGLKKRTFVETQVNNGHTIKCYFVDGKDRPFPPLHGARLDIFFHGIFLGIIETGSEKFYFTPWNDLSKAQ